MNPKRADDVRRADDAVALQQTLHILEERAPKYDPRTPEKLGQLYSNELVDCINDFDREKIRAQAKSFKM